MQKGGIKSLNEIRNFTVSIIFQSKGVVCPRQAVPYDVVTNNLPDLRVPCGAISYLSDRSRNLISVLNLLCLLIYYCNRW